MAWQGKGPGAEPTSSIRPMLRGRGKLEFSNHDQLPSKAKPRFLIWYIYNKYLQ
jgi:hypothetical protein